MRCRRFHFLALTSVVDATPEPPVQVPATHPGRRSISIDTLTGRYCRRAGCSGGTTVVEDATLADSGSCGTHLAVGAASFDDLAADPIDSRPTTSAVPEFHLVDVPDDVTARAGGYPVSITVANARLDSVLMISVGLTIMGTADRTPGYTLHPDPANPLLPAAVSRPAGTAGLLLAP